MSHNPAETDDELLLRIRSGDEEAFLTLYRRCQAAIYRFAMHMSGSAIVAEDVTQEVFMALIRDECGYDPERGTLAGYLYGIARNLVLRHLERGKADVPLDTGDENSILLELSTAPDQLSGLTTQEGLKALRHAVQALPRRYREVVVLCDLEEMDYAQAASVLGCPVGTVRSRLHRARALLLDKMQQDKAQGPAGALKPVRCVI